jgi:formate dehydrogenase subunit delta
MNDDALARRANRIAAFYVSYPAEEARAGVAEYLCRLRDPRMRRRLTEHIRAGPAGLDPIVRDAAPRLAEDTAA